MSDLSDIRKFNTQRHHLTLGGLFLSIFVMIVAVAVLPVADTPLTYFLVLVLLVVTLIPVFIGIASKSLDVFELIYPISALYFLHFGVRTLYILSFPADFHLMYWGYPPTMDLADVTSVTSKKTSRFKNPLGEFIFQQMLVIAYMEPFDDRPNGATL